MTAEEEIQVEIDLRDILKEDPEGPDKEERITLLKDWATSRLKYV